MHKKWRKRINGGGDVWTGGDEDGGGQKEIEERWDSVGFRKEKRKEKLDIWVRENF